MSVQPADAVGQGVQTPTDRPVVGSESTEAPGTPWAVTVQVAVADRAAGPVGFGRGPSSSLFFRSLIDMDPILPPTLSPDGPRTPPP